VNEAERRRWSRAGILALRVGVGSLLCLAGLSKLGSAWEFAETLANYRLLPAQANQILSVILPWWEITAGLLLVLGLWVRASALFSMGLFSVFVISITLALARGLDVQCGCFGNVVGTRTGLRLLFLDSLGLGLSACLFLAGPPEEMKNFQSVT
jgi:uncharacterized membrane protein YphA (DoxX/SURF4 family)